MAPTDAYQHSTAYAMASMKNTFLHVEASNDDEFDLDDTTWLMRRQASEPTPPKRQLSGVNYRTTHLGSCKEEQADENDKSSDSDDPDAFDIANVLIRPGSCLQRQISASLEAVGDMDRQISSRSVQNSFERQISSMSNQGLDSFGRQESFLDSFGRQTSTLSVHNICRQVTEQNWPTYQQNEGMRTPPKEANFIGSQASAMQQIPQFGTQPLPHTLPGDFAEKEREQRDAEASRMEEAFGSCPANMLGMNPMLQMNPLMMACAMNAMTWQQMQQDLEPPAPASTGAGKNQSSSMQAKTRRKSRSLVTMAQEAQRQRQLEWAQQLEQQLQQQVKGRGMAAPQAAPASEAAPAPAAVRDAVDLEHEETHKKEVVSDTSTTDSKETPNKGKAAPKFCGYCGNAIKEHFKFCQYCGKSLRLT